jgi:hypothetical protein
MNIAIYNKKLWMSNAVIIASLLLALYFPVDNVIQLLVAHIVFLVALPLLYIHFLLKEKVSAFGISWGKVGEGSLWLALGLIVIGIGLGVLSQFTDILSRFSLPLTLRLSFGLFLLYLAIIGIYIFIFEFFFRGFVLFVWESVLGMKAIVVQTYFFMMFIMLLSYQKTVISLIFITVMALLSGLIATRSRSIVYSFSFSYISAILGIVSVILFVK